MRLEIALDARMKRHEVLVEIGGGLNWRVGVETEEMSPEE